MLDKIEKLKEVLSKPKKIVITTHRGPDGDAMGSSLGLYHFLSKINHDVNVITPNDYASFLHWLPGNDKVIEYESSKEESESLVNNADVIFMLDFNHIYRIDGLASNVESSNAFKVLIDHHQDPQENIADLIFSEPTICSTAQLLFQIIDKMNLFSVSIIESFEKPPEAFLCPPPLKIEAISCTLKLFLDLKLPLKDPSTCSFNSNAIFAPFTNLTTSIMKSVSSGDILYFL